VPDTLSLLLPPHCHHRYRPISVSHLACTSSVMHYLTQCAPNPPYPCPLSKHRFSGTTPSKFHPPPTCHSSHVAGPSLTPQTTITNKCSRDRMGNPGSQPTHSTTMMGQRCLVLEIETAIRKTPSEKALVLGLFYKTCWTMVKDDVIGAKRSLFSPRQLLEPPKLS
jgi:hypothetical protein